MNGVKYLVGNEDISNRPMRPYSGDACAFIAALSGELLKIPEAKRFPDVVSLAFWCRKGNINKLKDNTNRENRLGRGLVFHVAPSNVPVNFAFSYLFSLLAGNANIVRVPSKPFPQIPIICGAITKVLEDFPEIKSRTAFVSYPVSDEITAAFSGIADARVIWGGDATVENVRTQKAKPRSVDVVFSDRYSLCVLDGNAVMQADNAAITRLADGFYNDTYLMDQNACSSPHLILWQNANDEAKNRFWKAVADLASNKYELQAAVAVDKYMLLCENAIDMDNLTGVIREENLLYRAQLSALPQDDLTCLRGKGGYFYEYDMTSFGEISPYITEKYQTITYFGIEPESLRDYIIEQGLRGIDRIVPIGSAMDIGVIWDGYDIVGMLSRIVTAI